MVGISVQASGARRCVACCRRSSAGLSDTLQATDPWEEAADTGRSEALPAAAFARIEYIAYRRHPLYHVTCFTRAVNRLAVRSLGSPAPRAQRGRHRSRSRAAARLSQRSRLGPACRGSICRAPPHRVSESRW
jgi:hypothetical protein